MGRANSGFEFYWGGGVVLMTAIAIFLGVTGHFGWAALAFVVSIVDALVLLAGMHYEKGTLHNVRRLINERPRLEL